MTRREFAVQFRGAMLNEAPDLTSDSALRRAMRARRKTRGIGYAGDAGPSRVGTLSKRLDADVVTSATAPAQTSAASHFESAMERAAIDLIPLLVRFRRIDR